MCNKYTIKYKANYREYGLPNFIFGYVTDKYMIKNWNQSLGDDNNKNSSVGISASCYYLSSSRFYLFDKNNKCKELNYKSSTIFKCGDIFNLTFDFVQKKLIIYHNYNFAVDISLNGNKSVIFVVSLKAHDTSIEILNYELT